MPNPEKGIRKEEDGTRHKRKQGKGTSLKGSKRVCAKYCKKEKKLLGYKDEKPHAYRAPFSSTIYPPAACASSRGEENKRNWRKK